jgi:ABC-type Fe3+-citrate transport system substrate-binding protein
MKNLISIFLLMLVVCVMTTSCASNSKRSHAKKHGLVKHGCGGLARLPKTHR